MAHWHAPVDPECPEVQEYMEALYSDPMTNYYGVGGEIAEMFERKHFSKCERCQEYGTANIEAVY